MTYSGTLNAALFVVFLEGLLAETKGKVTRSSTGSCAHDCEEVWDWVEEHSDRIAMFLLPGGSWS